MTFVLNKMLPVMFIGNALLTAAIARAGEGVPIPMFCGISVIIAGLWGLIYYREIKGACHASLWMICASWTVVMISTSKEGG